MAGAQIPTGITILNSYLGYFGISLTNFNTSASTAIAAGSKIEIAGAFFTFASDDTPDATSWTAITTATTAYISLTPSGTAGSQILTSAWTATTPVWSTSKQGWYTSAGSNIRLVASVYKTSATQYDKKTILTGWQVENSHNSEFFSTAGTWTAPSGVYTARLTGCGRGGNGYQGDNTINAGGGGAGGGGAAFCIKAAVSVIPLTVYTILVGDSSSGTSFGTYLYLGNGVSATTYTVGGSAGTCIPTADTIYTFNGGVGGRGGTHGTSGIKIAENGSSSTLLTKGGAGAPSLFYWNGTSNTNLTGGGGGGASYGNGGDGAPWGSGSTGTSIVVPSAQSGSFGGGGGGGTSHYFSTTGSNFFSPGASGGSPFLTIEW